ncbi:MAG: methylmalonyl-CoA epimerase [Halobacteriales archaeon]|nr:methylmalonyl-CoA epimerase [Halobacteriales archaeon]
MELDHIGIATDDAEGVAEMYADLFGFNIVHDEVFEDELEIVFLDVGGGYLELLEPYDDYDGPIEHFLDERGPGIHHLAVRTPDLSKTLRRVRTYEWELIDETPRRGAWNTEIAFIHPRSSGGILIELVER